MAKPKRLTEEEEILIVLKREGFTEIPAEKIKEEPYRSLYTLPDCFKEMNKKKVRNKRAG